MKIRQSVVSHVAIPLVVMAKVVPIRSGVFAFPHFAIANSALSLWCQHEARKTRFAGSDGLSKDAKFRIPCATAAALAAVVRGAGWCVLLLVNLNPGNKNAMKPS
jgi:hypothetical protein